ncbi:hypothetical protein PF004_g14189 [Phytophthora fragariae]|uniref:Uncharacterized protein n=1 Tax=Phytophthora fragariae TaxID=53985 RepID=A0A6G0NPY3_9STRA|nr:hypothetical protein PF004_g14189 [Phytophthora fragariae]
MKALYERVLAQLPTPRLHESCNAVLKEEFASVSQTLGDVVAAFVKLQEVHDAVSKLQQRHQSTGGHSNSLRASMDEATELHRRVQRQVGKLVVGIKAAPVERKRKRKYEVPGAINSVGDDDDDESDEDADKVEGSEAAWKALTTKGKSSSNTKAAPSPAKPPAKQTETDTSTTKPSKESAVYMSTIVEVMKKLSVVGRWLIIPEVLTALKESVEEDVDGLQQSAVTSSLKVLLWSSRTQIGFRVQIKTTSWRGW